MYIVYRKERTKPFVYWAAMDTVYKKLKLQSNVPYEYKIHYLLGVCLTDSMLRHRHAGSSGLMGRLSCLVLSNPFMLLLINFLSVSSITITVGKGIK